LDSFLAAAALVVVLPTLLLSFPAGLTVFFERLLNPATASLPRPEGNQTLGCLVYALLALVGMCVRERRWFRSIFAVWIALLIANIVGCQPLIDWTLEEGFGAAPAGNRKR